MKTHCLTTSILPFAMVFGIAAFAGAAEPAESASVNPSPAASELDWLKRADKVHAIGCDNWITAAWTTMLIEQGIIPAEDAPEVARAVLEMLEKPPAPRESGWDYFHKIQAQFDKRLGKKAGGNVMLTRTTPPARQTVFIRYHLLKRMCQIYDMQLATLNLANKHTETIMPGYTHTRHAQPTTFGHYILSVFDAVQRSTKTLELGYHLMSLNEMGCGALAGTSWPIDRDLVSEYLGKEGLIENANDAVSYTDGYLVVVCGLTNVTNVVSRMALDLSYWSGDEYGFLEIGSHGKSFLMPQKTNNPNSMEITRLQAGQMIGHLTAVAVAGLREPHGDTHAMLNLETPTLAALGVAETCVGITTREMQQMQADPQRMLAVIRQSYIASTELANQMVRDYGLDYRTAHTIIHQFVRASEAQNIPATDARAELLEAAAQNVLGKKLGMTDDRLRELLDPTHFVKATNSKGGVAPEETARMIAARREELANARARHLKRIETLEKAQERLFADLRKAAANSENKK